MELFDLKNLKNKKHQHYVPQFYLNLWVSSGVFFVKNSMGVEPKTYPKKTTVDVGEENYFYAIEMDEVVWDMLSYRFGEEAKSNPVVALVMQEFFRLKAMDDVAVRGVGIVNNDDALRENARGILAYLKKHHLEDAYSNIEGAVSIEIESFSRSQESDVWVPPSGDTFMHVLVFFCFQSFRTKSCIDNLDLQISQMSLKRGAESVDLTPEQKRSVLKCMLYVFSFQMCQRIYESGCTMNIMKNKTNLNYLTSDSPAVYFDSSVLGAGVESYGIMPLSPKLLVHINVNDGDVPRGSELKIFDVHDLVFVKEVNKRIESHSHNFVFAKNMNDFCWQE